MKSEWDEVLNKNNITSIYYGNSYNWLLHNQVFSSKLKHLTNFVSCYKTSTWCQSIVPVPSSPLLQHLQTPAVVFYTLLLMFNVSPTILNVPEVVLSENLLFIVTDVWKPKRHVAFRLQMQGSKGQIHAGRLYRELV